MFDLHTLVIPICEGESHWTLIAVFCQEKKIQYYDSCKGNGKVYVDAVYRYLGDEWIRRGYGGKLEDHNEGKEWTLNYVSPSKYPKQQNGYDCGVYVCCAVDLLRCKEPMPTKTSEEFVRRMTIAAKILTRCLAGPPADVESVAHVENTNVGAVENVENANVEANVEKASVEANAEDANVEAVVENANVEAVVEDAKTVVVASEGLPIVETVGEHDAD